jgi:branched-chain amino acid transport system permease protein
VESAAAVGVAQRRAAIRGSIAGKVGSWLLLALVAVVAVYLVVKIAQRPPAYFIQTLAYGVADGAIYALVALGYTMVYGIIELINFAHGDVFTLGAFISVAIMPTFGLVEGKSSGFAILAGLIAVFLITMAACAVINVAIERVAYRPLRGAPRLAPLITAVGMSFILEGIMFLWKGPFNLHYPNLLPQSRIPLGGGVSIGTKDAMVIIAAVLLVVALALFVNLSKLGKAMRATAQDRDAAQLMGININRTIAATFFIGAALAGAGGIIYGLYFNFVSFDTGFQAGLIAFTAAVFGGIGNIQGAAIGGLLIGIIAALWTGYFSAAWTPVTVFAILILVLVFRPTGLLGMRVPEK